VIYTVTPQITDMNVRQKGPSWDRAMIEVDGGLYQFEVTTATHQNQSDVIRH
jgi:hypothetical protein